MSKSAVRSTVGLHSVVKKQGEGRALGFVASRTLEAAGIFIGLAFLLSVVNLR